jgi:hypothetical protein
MNNPNQTHEFYDIDNAKSYATVDNLNKALTKLGFLDHHHLVVYNSKGRATAIFPSSNVMTNRYGHQGNLMLYAHHGFKTLG